MARTKTVKKKSQGKWYSAYTKERGRILKRVRELKRRGYYVSKDFGNLIKIIDGKEVVAKIPDTIRKRDVESLQKKDLNYIYSKMRYFDRETGEDVSGLERRKQERKQSSKKSAETRKRRKQYYEANEEDYQPSDNVTEISFSQVTIQNFRSTVHDILPAVENIINNFIDDLISKYGEQDVAQMLRDAAEARSMIERLYEISDSLEKLKDFLNELIDYLPEAGEFTKDVMKTKIENMMYEDMSWEYYDESQDI